MVNKVGSASALSYVSQPVVHSKPKQHASSSSYEAIPFVLRDNGVQWLAKAGINGHTMAINPVRIEAPPAKVWALVKNIDRYGEFSGGKVEAHMANGAALATGNQVELSLKIPLNWIKELIFGSQIAHSDETVILDDSAMALGWHRKVPLACGRESERWQIVVPTGDNACTYYSGLYIPGLPGELAIAGVGKEILDAFESIIKGIKTRVEA